MMMWSIVSITLLLFQQSILALPSSPRLAQSTSIQSSNQQGQVQITHHVISNQPQFHITRRTYKSDPYTTTPIFQSPTFFPQHQVAQSRIFDTMSTAASIVPALFGFKKSVFFEPHRYFNLCPLVPPGANTLWSVACHSNNPFPITGPQPVAWGTAQPPPPPTSAIPTPYQGGWSGGPAATANSNSLSAFGFPSVMMPYYANVGYPQMVPNANGYDVGNLFASSSGSGSSSAGYYGEPFPTNDALFYNPLLGVNNGGNGGTTALYSSSSNDAGGLSTPLVIPLTYGYISVPPGESWNKHRNNDEENNDNDESKEDSLESRQDIKAAAVASSTNTDDKIVNDAENSLILSSKK